MSMSDIEYRQLYRSTHYYDGFSRYEREPFVVVGCATCKFWEHAEAEAREFYAAAHRLVHESWAYGENKRDGYCLRHAPTAGGHHDKSGFWQTHLPEDRFPMTYRDDWCGQFVSIFEEGE